MPGAIYCRHVIPYGQYRPWGPVSQIHLRARDQALVEVYVRAEFTRSRPP